jgi:predicted O-methyltransferase YrrM
VHRVPDHWPHVARSESLRCHAAQAAEADDREKPMTPYRTVSWLPPLVERALEMAEAAAFTESCTHEVGRLLYTLAAHCNHGTVAEIGTGYGVGAAWIASGLPPSASLVTVEIDEAKAAAARSLFSSYPNVLVLHGDWHEILAYAPFTMLFADGGKAKERESEVLLEALEPGGLVVLDDLTPEDQWTPEQQQRWNPDPVRSFWLNHPRLAATEILVTPASAVIRAVRLR